MAITACSDRDPFDFASPSVQQRGYFISVRLLFHCVFPKTTKKNTFPSISAGYYKASSNAEPAFESLTTPAILYRTGHCSSSKTNISTVARNNNKKSFNYLLNVAT